MRSIYSGVLVLAFCLSAPAMLASCGDDDTTVRRTAVQLSAHAVMPSEFHDFSVVVPASFAAKRPSLEDAMAPETVKTIGLLKPEYEEALVTDALNFTEVRRRT